MANPWLRVPLEDYEGHMNSAHVQQLTALSELFAEVLALCRPASLAVLGIAGGNGLEHIDHRVTKHVIGIDVNPEYLRVVERRYAAKCNPELHCVDLANDAVDLNPVELVHAALVLEHAGTRCCLDNAVALVAPGGALSAVLQLPSDVEQGVSPTSFASIQELKDHFDFVDPIWLKNELAERGFKLEHESRRSLPAGKAFWLGVFRKRTLP